MSRPHWADRAVFDCIPRDEHGRFDMLRVYDMTIDEKRQLLVSLQLVGAWDSGSDRTDEVGSLARYLSACIDKHERRERNRRNASEPRATGKLPRQSKLLEQFSELVVQKGNERDAHSALYAKYPEVTPKAIRDKLDRAKKRIRSAR